MDRVVRRDGHHGSFVDQEHNLNDGARRLALVTNMSVDSRLTQAENEKSRMKNHFSWRFEYFARHKINDERRDLCEHKRVADKEPPPVFHHFSLNLLRDGMKNVFMRNVK